MDDTQKVSGERGTKIQVQTGREREKGFGSGSTKSFADSRMKGDAHSVEHSLQGGKVRKY